MDRRRNDPEYQIHEPDQPQRDEEGRLSKEERENLSVQAENTPGAVQQRQNMNRAPPSEVRENTPVD